MKKLLLRAVLALLAGASLAPAFGYISTPSDASALPVTKNLYNYIASRAGQSTNKMVVGQHLGGLNQILYPSLYGNFDIDEHAVDGKLPGMVGSRYDSDDKQTGHYVLDASVCTAINDELITMWNQHQPIIHLTAIPPNPWNRDSGRDPYQSGNNIADLLIDAPWSQAQQNFWDDIDVIADALQELQDAGIPVVFRPFAEFNMTNKYYYSGQHDYDFTALWQDVYDYYVGVRGLHNLLFCWEVWALNRNSSTGSISSWYPGDSCVDIVAGAYYFKPGVSYTDGSGNFTFANSGFPTDQTIFNYLVASNRPFGAAQYGLNYDANGGGGYGDHDFTLKFMDYAPQMAFAYYWQKEYAVENQDNAISFVNESRVATAEDLPGFSTFTFVSTGAEDGWVLESAQDTGTGGTFDATGNGASGLKTGDDGSKRQFKAIVSFDTSALPDGATITSASLKLTRAALNGSVSNLGNLTVDIKSGYFGTSQSLEASDFQATAAQTGVATLAVPGANGSSTTGSLSSGSLTSIKKNGRTQLRIYFSTAHDTDSTADNIGWYSGDNATAGNRPQFTVEYKYQ